MGGLKNLMPGLRKAALRAVAVTALLSVAPASARQAQEYDDYVVYYNALPTQLIPPSAASEYGIRRSDSRGLLNIAVEKKAENGKPQSVAAEISVRAVNLAGQIKEVDLRDVGSGGYTYYIGTFPVADREVVEFALEIRPQGSTRELQLQFQSRFIADPEFLE